ncbi:hypothetical protein [Amycolatopsis australiensis]|uniref:hypothetical protein n=1 Tax=Amycolatopsis australiensis TaxID=546364 RepID=UPI0011612547|nr:hypothetical protein [Amycolatopsis australiensis]
MAIVYIIGMLVTSVVVRRRAGVRHFGRISVSQMGIGWFLKAMAVTAFWPVALVVGLIKRATEQDDAPAQR